MESVEKLRKLLAVKEFYHMIEKSDKTRGAVLMRIARLEARDGVPAEESCYDIFARAYPGDVRAIGNFLVEQERSQKEVNTLKVETPEKEPEKGTPEGGSRWKSAQNTSSETRQDQEIQRGRRRTGESRGLRFLDELGKLPTLCSRINIFMLWLYLTASIRLVDGQADPKCQTYPGPVKPGNCSIEYHQCGLNILFGPPDEEGNPLPEVCVAMQGFWSKKFDLRKATQQLLERTAAIEQLQMNLRAWFDQWEQCYCHIGAIYKANPALYTGCTDVKPVNKEFAGAFDAVMACKDSLKKQLAYWTKLAMTLKLIAQGPTMEECEAV